MTWQDSRSTDRRHHHTPVRDEKGQMVCTQCRQIIIRPITDVDDDRLVDAGLMRSEPQPGDETEEFLQPLPLILIALHDHGEEYGYRPAPVAPYVVQVLHDGENIRDDDLWERLAAKV